MSNVGQLVQVAVDVSEGAFPGERLITIDTMNGPVSGFVKEEEIKYTTAGNPYIVGRIKEVTEDALVVQLHGSFFTTTGITYLPKEGRGIRLVPAV